MLANFGRALLNSPTGIIGHFTFGFDFLLLLYFFFKLFETTL